jgi:hypothetical protein
MAIFLFYSLSSSPLSADALYVCVMSKTLLDAHPCYRRAGRRLSLPPEKQPALHHHWRKDLAAQITEFAITLLAPPLPSARRD